LKLSLNWLGDFVDLNDIPLEKLIDRLTLSTCEVDGFEKIYSHLENVVLAEVLTVEKHPSADRLSVCQVKAGTQKWTIVCGAPNVAAGQLVPLAKVGCELPSADGVKKISETNIRGVVSKGMLCSAQEIGLEKITGETAGLLVLNDRIAAEKTGTPLSEIFPLKDTILDIDNKSITHRPDLWCHFGFAREIAAIFHKKIKFDPLASKKPAADPSLPVKKIQIEKGTAKAYYGMHCANVETRPAPFWMQARLIAIGQKPINNIVDASNYLLFEIGQPNHAFNAAKLKSDIITVASQGGSYRLKNFTTLDEETRSVPEGTIVIYDGRGEKAIPVALGGIMGGLESGIAEDTKSLFLESATFPREKIRATLSSLPLRTDSAVRFEKGQDPSKAEKALYRLYDLLKESCPGIRAGKISGSAPEPGKRSKIVVQLSFLQKRLGFAVPPAEVKSVLTRLGYDVKAPAAKGDVKYTLSAPSYRSQYDVTIPEDIVEELGRIHGYDNIDPAPPLSPVEPTPVNRERMFERQFKLHMHAEGFTETRNYSFVPEDDNLAFGSAGLALKNPLASGQNRLRLSQVPGLLKQGTANQDRFAKVQLFEFGRVYFKNPADQKTDLARELRRCTVLAIDSGDENVEGAFLKFRLSIEKVLLRSIPHALTLEENSDASSGIYSASFLHPKCSLKITDGAGGKVLGVIGMLNPGWAKKYDIKRGAFLCDFYLDELFALYEKNRTVSRYSVPSIYPDSDFEFSILMPENAPTHIPARIVTGLGIDEIKSVELITIYRGEPLPPRTQSASFRVLCGRKDRTMKGEEIQSIMDSIISKLSAAGYPLR